LAIMLHSIAAAAAFFLLSPSQLTSSSEVELIPDGDNLEA
jgi:hypothetical protein